MKKFLYLTLLLLVVVSCNKKDKDNSAFNPEYPFLDYRLSIDERVNDLVSRMTLEEKVGQMMYTAPAIDRLGVPEYNWWNECLHGIARNGKATVFPQAIGLGATFDTDLIKRISSAISDEARAKFEIAKSINNRGQYAGLTFWSPNVNIFRDPRWGRGQETYGEDPMLSAKIGTAFVTGLQGDDPDYLKTAACAKHYVVHSGPERDRHVFNAESNPKDLYETYFPAFKALADAGVEGFMCAYNRTNSEACCGSPTLLLDVLRDDWGFEGYITSDCWALVDFHEGHKISAGPAESAALALKSGVNLNCGSVYDPYLLEAVKKGLVTEIEIDASLKTLLRTRFKLGLFDPDEMNPFRNIQPSVINSVEHQELAREAARKSMVLLKNNNVLPLSKDLKSIYVAGPGASNLDVLLGNYYGVNDNMVTFLEGIISAVNMGTTVQYKPAFLLDRTNPNPIDWAAGEAGTTDATIVIAGISGLIEGEEGESIASEHFGDRLDYGLPDNQVAYIKKLRSVGKKPLILVLTAGSPVDISEVEEFADAIIYAWYPGEQGGNALADIIFGDYNPSGRLPITFPKSLDQLPAYEDYSMKGRTYKYMNQDPFYPFGYGLSYTEFDYKELKSNSQSISKDGELLVSLNIQNSGEKSGEEVVQLYISYPEQIENAPNSTLIDFKRVMIDSGGNANVEFRLSANDFMGVDEAGNRVLVPGEYKIHVSGASPMNRSKELGVELLTTAITVQ